MSKGYTEELAKWVAEKNKKRPRQDKGLVAFLAAKSDIEAALKEGYSKKTIWAHMKETGKISFRYETFLKHVKKHIDNAPSPVDASGENHAQQGKTAQPKRTQQQRQKKEFNMDSQPKSEDLI